MTTYLVFENSGEIDLRSVSTFGCSVKESKNPIGFFGTGLKYAIAVLLRTGHEVKLQAGIQQFRAIAIADDLRGKQFEFVSLQGEGQTTALGFTTELGKTWLPWMAYRELHCNAIDEPEHKVFVSESIPEARAGVTRIIVAGDGILAAHNSRREFILEGTPAFRLGSIEVYNQPTASFFYKGIKVMEFQHQAMFAYNLTEHVDLTEDRTVKDQCVVPYTLSRAMLAYAERSVLEKVLVASDKHIEHYFDYHGWAGSSPGPDFFPTVAALQRSSLSKINLTALRLWHESAGGIIDPRRINPTKVQSLMLEKAIAFCELSGFMLRGEYPIILVESLGETATLAIADTVGKQIFLTERLFETHGTKGVARALIEEYLHLRFGLKDCTREMQNFIFDKMISLAEELQGTPI